MTLIRAPWDHQADAIAAVARRFASGHRGMLLHMDMGTGKGLVACAMFDGLKGPVLVVCPKNVVGVWRKEVPANLDGWRVTCIEGLNANVRRKRLQQALLHGDRHVIVVNTEALRSDPVFVVLLNVEWSMLIVDESHRVKAHAGKDSKRVRVIAENADYTLCLTGTPMPHDPLDIWAQSKIVAPDALPASWFAFRKRYEKVERRKNNTGVTYDAHVDWINLAELYEKIEPFMHRCSREQARLSLPTCTHQVVPVVLEGRQAKAYRQMYREAVILLGETIADGAVVSPNVLSQLVRLQQVCSGAVGGVDLDDATVVEVVGTAKRDALADLLVEVRKEELGPVVVFCRFTHSVREVEAVAAELGLTYGELSGRRRDGLTEHSTLAEGCDVVAVQYQSGGVGVDFTRSAQVVCFDQVWDLGQFDQAMARCDRPGQTRPVLVQHLIAELDGGETIDGRIRAVVDERRDFLASLLDGNL